MHKVMSDKQLAANRRNAKRSTGPRTHAGKARSARNNTRHGLFSRDLFLTAGPDPEDPAEFEAFRRSLHAERDCKGAGLARDGVIARLDDSYRSALIDRLARLFWLQRRAYRFESLANAAPTPQAAGIDANLAYFHHPSFSALIRFENRINRLLHATLKSLHESSSISHLQTGSVRATTFPLFSWESVGVRAGRCTSASTQLVGVPAPHEVEVCRHAAKVPVPDEIPTSRAAIFLLDNRGRKGIAKSETQTPSIGFRAARVSRRFAIKKDDSSNPSSTATLVHSPCNESRDEGRTSYTKLTLVGLNLPARAPPLFDRSNIIQRPRKHTLAAGALRPDRPTDPNDIGLVGTRQPWDTPLVQCGTALTDFDPLARVNLFSGGNFSVALAR